MPIPNTAVLYGAGLDIGNGSIESPPPPPVELQALNSSRYKSILKMFTKESLSNLFTNGVNNLTTPFQLKT